MRKSFLLCFFATLTVNIVAQKPAIFPDIEIERKIEAKLMTMSLDDKVGQMLQLDVNVLGSYDSLTGKWRLDEEKLDTVISKYRIGSVLNTPNDRAWPTEEWQEWISLIQEKSMKELGIPCLYGLDSNHGVSYVQGGTMFPQPINIAATFNTLFARQIGEVTAYESRAADCPWTFNPVVDLGRDPRWPRIWESFGEDAIVNARMVESQVRGYQGDDPNHLGEYNVAACVKHYFAYGAPFSGKDRTPAYIAPNMLREKYFEPFKDAILAGALSLMVNSGSINGVPVHASWEYLTKWLKEDLNWDGMIVTDWADISSLYKRERVAKDKKDAIRLAINAGVDMSMDPYSTDFCVLLKELVEEGKVSQGRIDDAVRRILRLKYRLGLFDEPNTGGRDFPQFGSEEHAKIALRAAEESEVLLKNSKDFLPLRPFDNHKLLVTGPNANQMRCLNGGWSYSWQGNKTDNFAQEYNTIYEALSNKYGKANVVLEQGVTYVEKGAYYEEDASQIEKAVEAAKGDIDVIIACIGENSYCESPGNLTDLWLSENQRNLVKELAKTGKPIVLILNEGRPRLIADIEPLATAIVDILLPSNYGADALANLLAGFTNFSAKLPYTYPKEINSLATYDYKVSEEIPTMAGAYDYDAKVSLQWPFGYGLSYTTFEYSNLRVDKTEFSPEDELTVTVDITNTGTWKGKEAVLLYTSDLVASVVPDNKRLRAFTKADVDYHQTTTAAFRLAAKDFAFVNADNKWTIEEGEFLIKVGPLSQKVYCNATKVWDEPNI